MKSSKPFMKREDLRPEDWERLTLIVSSKSDFEKEYLGEWSMSDKMDVGPLCVNFRTKIRADGAIVTISLTQFEAEIELSREQALSLARIIEAKFGKK